MKRKDLIKLLERNGWIFKREGGAHSVYSKRSANEYVPRHREIDEDLAKSIIRNRKLK